MIGNLRLVTDASDEPVTLEEAKLHLRVDIDADDDLIAALATTARQAVENFTRRALLSQDWELRLDEFPDESVLEIPLPPLQEVSAITYTDDDGVSHTFDSSNYVVDTGSTPGRIALKDGASWPGEPLAPLAGVQIAFTAGYASADEIPRPLRQGVLLMLGHLYENREATTTEKAVAMLPMGLEYLLWAYRVMGW